MLAFVPSNVHLLCQGSQHLKVQLHGSESSHLRSSLYVQVFIILRIELLQRKQSLTFLHKEKQHTLFIVLSFFFAIHIMLSVLLKSAVPGARLWLWNLRMCGIQNGNEIVLAEKCLEMKAQRKQISNAKKQRIQIYKLNWHTIGAQRTIQFQVVTENCCY